MNTISNADIEKTAHEVAAAARANGANEHEVAAAFASVLPHQVWPTLPALPTRDHETDLDRRVYDIGVQTALQGKALPLEPHPALEAGYQDTRAAMLAQLRPKQDEPVATEEAQPSGKGETTSDDLNATSQHPGGEVSAERAAAIEYEAGANIARRGGKLPDAATESAKAGFASVTG